MKEQYKAAIRVSKKKNVAIFKIKKIQQNIYQYKYIEIDSKQKIFDKKEKLIKKYICKICGERDLRIDSVYKNREILLSIQNSGALRFYSQNFAQFRPAHTHTQHTTTRCIDMYTYIDI